MLVVILLFVALGLFGLKIYGIGKWNEEFLSLENTKALQALCAFGVILHHLSQRLKTPDVLSPFVDAGVLFVGVFLFCSGYGLIKSYQSKQNYLQGFIRRRLPSVLVPLYATIIIYLVYNLIEGQRFSPVEIVLFLTGFILINPQAWFAVAIVIFYIAFYIIFKYCKKERTAFWGMAVFLLVYTIICACLGHGGFWFQGEWWYNTCFLFLFGMLAGRFEGNIISFAKKRYAILTPVLIVLFFPVFILNLYMLKHVSYYANTPFQSDIPERFLCLSVQLPAIVLFVAAVLLITMKVRFNNKILQLLGQMTLELYLIQYLFIILLRSRFIQINNDVMYVLLVLILSTLTAFGLHILDTKIISLIGGKHRYLKRVESSIKQ
ncbi:acyltransferase family protein [Acetanaerobacterium elongatum]|uniref:Membrane-bound acyltransferase YfiQ, involved in biofilm formation n=1 Tax=Acetanaerobacterium elongatum TaxID=258515 RepID=A0A1G9ZDH2_9FIRM|nr:acyltransferase [Acetanaerobacterium elongatum]SDN19177.1 Membrane-bound acyltransferase YfiQ, involved in biofilm formation [Acetanaerobacterium elongatum]